VAPEAGGAMTGFVLSAILWAVIMIALAALVERFVAGLRNGYRSASHPAVRRAEARRRAATRKPSGHPHAVMFFGAVGSAMFFYEWQHGGAVWLSVAVVLALLLAGTRKGVNLYNGLREADRRAGRKAIERGLAVALEEDLAWPNSDGSIENIGLAALYDRVATERWGAGWMAYSSEADHADAVGRADGEIEMWHHGWAGQ